MKGYEVVSPEAAVKALAGHPSWVVGRGHIYRDYRFASFRSAMAFVNRVADLAERVRHHPNITVHEWCFVQLELYSHITGTITSRDLEFVAALDADESEVGGTA